MPRPGGPAAKAGHYYEELWTVRAMLSVLHEQAASITVEEVGLDDAEFRLRFASPDDGDEVWQVKRQPPGQGWTLYKLDREGVLAAIATQLDVPGRTYIFASQVVPAYLLELVERVSRGDINGLPQYLEDEMTELRKRWGGVSVENAWARLRRVRIEGSVEAGFRRDIDVMLAGTLTGEPADVRAALAELAYEGMHQELFADGIWSSLAQRGFHPAQLGKDPAAAVALVNATERFLQQVQFSRPAFHIARSVQQSVVDGIASGPKVIVVSGRAGAGKSVVISEVVETIRARELPVLAAAVTRLNKPLTPQEVGAQLELPASPAILLHGVAAGRPGVLVLDQVDALSTASGPMTAIFHPIREVVHEALTLGLTVVVGCRSFDLQADPDLRALLAGAGSQAVEVGPLTRDDITAALTQVGISADVLRERQLRLLDLPLHLKLLADAVSGQASPRLDFKSATDLFDLYWERKESAVRERMNGVSSWPEVISRMCQAMSTGQSLSVPVSEFDNLRPTVDAMISENVIGKENGRLAFFHQAFFDYAFARTWLTQQTTVVAFLLGGEQSFFRRAQLRSLLALLRDTDRARYAEEFKELLASQSVRFHLKELAFSFLGDQAVPMDAELGLLLQYFDGGTATGESRYAFRVFRRSPACFRWLADTGRIAEWLASTDTDLVNAVVTILGDHQREAPDKVGALLEPHCAAGGDWPARLVWIARVGDWSASRGFFELMLRLVTDGTLETGGIADSTMLAYDLPQKKPEWANEMLAAVLRRAWEKNQPSPVDGIANLGPATDPSWIVRCAELSPSSFVLLVVPVMIEIITASMGGPDADVRKDRIWPYLMYGSAHDLQGALMEAAVSAVRSVATTDRVRWAETSAILRKANSETCDFLVANGWAAAGEAFADEAADFLLERDSRFQLGYMDAPRAVSQELIHAVSPHCSEDRFQSLEQRLLNYLPDWERRAENLQARGSASWRLLHALPNDRTSDTGKKRLRELDRKFGESWTETPRGVITRFVGPPIPVENAKLMSDEQWLRAIRKYN